MGIYEEKISDIHAFKDSLYLKVKADLDRARNDVNNKLNKLFDRLTQLKTDGEKFHETITETSETQDKYSENVYKKISSSISEIIRPEEITHKTINEFMSNLDSTLRQLDREIVRFVRLMGDPKYKRRVKNLSSALIRLNKEHGSFRGHIEKKYAIATSYEELLDGADSLAEYFNKILQIDNEIEELKPDIDEIESQINSLNEQKIELENNPLENELEKLKIEANNIVKQLEDKLSAIKYGLKKLDRLSSTETGLLDQPTRQFLSSLISTPGEVIREETSGYPKIKNLINQLVDNLDNQFLQLKKERREQIHIDQKEMCENNSLNALQSEIKEIKDKIDSLSNKIKIEDFAGKKEELDNEISGLFRSKERLTVTQFRDKSRLQEECKTLINHINEELTNLRLGVKRLEQL
ncbi:MAG: coiled-coil domain-containing protein [Candidatus Kariarchaeaceae archaeon]